MKRSILKTLHYHDLFDYPLTFEEIHKLLVGKGARPLLSDHLQEMVKAGKVKVKDGFYHLSRRDHLIEKRKQRNFASEAKLKIAGSAARILRVIPTVKMVAVTGGLSMKNSDPEDDVDIFIVAKAKRVWLTRLLTSLLLDLLGRRRKAGEEEEADKICLNMYASEGSLRLPKNEQSIYTAHEVAQLRPIWDKDGTYARFVAENAWVKDHLGNWPPLAEASEGKEQPEGGFRKVLGAVLNPFILGMILGFIFDLFEEIAYRAQLSFMAKRRTTEKVEKDRIMFHPQDMTPKVLAEYEKRVDKLKKIA